MNYSDVLKYAFKRFSAMHAPRTILPTAGYFFSPWAFPASDKPALCTMNILPPMMTVWHHFARKALGDRADIVIFDCSGTLNPAEFPECRVQKFLNLYASTKADIFLKQMSRNRRISWLCDDDVFLLSGELLDILDREFATPNTASVSFKRRTWWHYDLGEGKTAPPSGSYCLALDRSIVIEKEHLSLAPEDGNPHPSHIPGREGEPVKRYDTFDRANEVLLRKGYRCVIPEEAIAQRCIAEFEGVSNAVMILNYFRTSQQTMDYLEGPPLKQWAGNILYRVLQGLLSILTVQELYTKLKGKTYPLPSLPSRSALETLRKRVEPFLRPELSFRGVDEAREKLRRAL